MIPVLVEPEVSRRKLRRELDRFIENAVRHERGWILLRQDVDNLFVELAFLGQIAVSAGSKPLPIVAAAIRLEYQNYDLWAPSLTFIDPFTHEPTKPHVRAFMSTEDGHRDVLIDGHPETGRPFLCFPGIREYHSHPQHSGDSWLLHRAAGEGSVSTVCDRVWRFMARNVVGLNISMLGLPGWPLRAQLSIVLAQGHIQERAGPTSPDQGGNRPPKASPH